MFAYTLRRLFAGVIMLILMSLVTYLLFFSGGLHPERSACGKNCSPAQWAQTKKALGYDKPAVVQWAEFLKGTVAGRTYPEDKALAKANPSLVSTCPAPCLGYSIVNTTNVKDEIKTGLPVSFSLAIVAFVMWIVGGVLFGVIAALRKGTIIDRGIVGIALVFYAFPTFFIGLFFLKFPAIQWQLFPVPSYVNLTDSPLGWLSNLLLPSLTLALVYMAGYVRMTRAFVLESFGEDYLRTARAKGLPERRVLFKHSLRASLTPIVTMAGLDFGGLVGGAIITETVFNYDGLGALAVDSVRTLDLPTIVGLVVVLAAFVILANIIVDILYAVIDPRVRLGWRRKDSEAMTHAAGSTMPDHAVGSPSGQAFLSVRDLLVHFPTVDGVVKATDGLSFDLERGKTLGIVGESGSGKSVSSSTILGLQRGSRAIVSGEILLDGTDLLSISDEQMRQRRGRDVAMIFQDPLSAMHPYYTVGNQIGEAYMVHHDVSKKAARARAIEMLERVGIPQPDRRVDDYPHQFSGGMRQRAMIAMGLINDPGLLIADEPTTALDVTVQAQILDLLQDLQREFNSAIIIITHDLGVVAEMADDVLVMYAGRCVEYGPTREILIQPQMPYTWGLLSSVPDVAGDTETRLVPIPGNPPSLLNPPTGCAFHPRCTHLDKVPGDLCRTELPELTRASTGGNHIKRCHLVHPETVWETEVLPEIAPDLANASAAETTAGSHREEPTS